MRTIPKDPIQEFNRWYRSAKSANASCLDRITLATTDSRGRPSARIVLFKGMSPEGGLRIFTNYNSRKARELSENPAAALIFYWVELGRQVRVEGKAIRLSAEESDGYWKTRPRLS